MIPRALRAMSVRADRATRWAPHLAAAAARYAITPPARLAAWLAQVVHESAGLARTSERLDYTAARLAAVWPHRFPTAADAAALAHRPEALANRVYASRLGNGDEASGDGWRFRGRGLVQLTGRRNYRACGLALGLPLDDEPDALLRPDVAARSAGWYWAPHAACACDRCYRGFPDGCNALADAESADGFKQITRIVNGGLTGYPDRAALWIAALGVL